jgi:hypothetical protein
LAQLGVAGNDFDANRGRDPESLSFSGLAGASNGVPLAAKGPAYLSAGRKISPDFLRMSLAEYGDGMAADGVPVEDDDDPMGVMPVKSSLRPVLRLEVMWISPFELGARSGGVMRTEGAANDDADSGDSEVS